MTLSITPNSHSVSLGSKGLLIFLHEADFGASQEFLSISVLQFPARPHPVLLGASKERQSWRHGTEMAKQEASMAETQVSGIPEPRARAARQSQGLTWDPRGPWHPRVPASHLSLVTLLSTLSCKERSSHFSELENVFFLFWLLFHFYFIQQLFLVCASLY